MADLSSSASRRQGQPKPQLAERTGTGVGSGKQFAAASRYLITLLLLMIGPNFAAAQASDPVPVRSGDEYTISVNVNMVVLHATAQNSKNVLVSGLDRDDFQIYEDGALQPVKYFSHQDVPVTVGLVVDNSGSMRPKLTDVVTAGLAFARSSNPQDQMFVVNFNERVSFGLPDTMAFTDRAAQLEVVLSRITANGQTALYDAVAAALEHLKKGNRDKKVLIVISDGGDNASKHSLAQIVALAGQSDAIVYTIGIFDVQDDDRNPGALKRLAKDTGGENFLPASSRDLAPICERIARDIRNQYTLAYVPTNRKRDGAYRVIQVKASGPGRGGLRIRTRTGYFAPLALPLPAAKTSSHDNPN